MRLIMPGPLPRSCGRGPDHARRAGIAGLLDAVPDSRRWGLVEEHHQPVAVLAENLGASHHAGAAADALVPVDVHEHLVSSLPVWPATAPRSAVRGLGGGSDG